MSLVKALNIAESALEANTTQMEVIAENIANVDTPNYQKQSVILSESLGGGVEVSQIVESDEPVSLEEEMTDMIRVQRAYQASMKVIETVDEMLETALEMVDKAHGKNDDDDDDDDN